MKLKRRYMLKNNQLKNYRKHLGLNQQQFWQALGMTQSAGSRYETGQRGLPPNVLAHIIQIHMLADIKVPDLIRSYYPELVKKLKQADGARGRA